MTAQPARATTAAVQCIQIRVRGRVQGVGFRPTVWRYAREKGEIVAVKALGGYQLACDATKAETVERLRALKRREAKPFALMARDLDVVRRFCAVSCWEEEALLSSAAPIVLLDASGPERLPEAVAPGMGTLGFMLPSTPLHVLMFRRMARPVVMTSGNVSDEPQATGDDEAARKLSAIAPYALVHDREIANRVDDSVMRLMAGRMRVLRRARGQAPASIRLPKSFEDAPEILAFGPEMKATFCLVKDGRAVLSQHQGDLENAATWDDYRKNLALYRDISSRMPRRRSPATCIPNMSPRSWRGRGPPVMACG